MAEGVILEFDGVGTEQYWAVNRALGLEGDAGDWPPGLLYHAGGAKPGGWVVFEVWASRDDQAAFMQGRLGRALQEGGVTAAPTRVEWLALERHVALG